MIYFIRHGETDYNKDNRWMGQQDRPLNQHGRYQIAEAARQLRDVNVDVIYTSPLIRARESAAVIRTTLGGLTPVYVAPWLTERGLGALEGLPKTPESRRALEQTQGLESSNDFRQRLSEVEALFNYGERLLLVSHSGVYKELIDFFNIETKPHRQRLDNADWVQLIRNY